MERTTKVLQLIQYFIQLCQHKRCITRTLLIAEIQIQRECSLFIRGFSNWAFSTSLTERQKQTIRCPVTSTTVAAGWVTNYSKKQKWGETRNQWGTILVNSSFEHDYYHHRKPASLAPNFDSDCVQLQRRQTAARNKRYQASGNNNAVYLRLTISLHPSRYVISSGNSRSKFCITCKNEEKKPLPQKQIHIVD